MQNMPYAYKQILHISFSLKFHQIYLIDHSYSSQYLGALLAEFTHWNRRRWIQYPHHSVEPQQKCICVMAKMAVPNDRYTIQPRRCRMAVAVLAFHNSEAA